MRARIWLISTLVIILLALLGATSWLVWANFFPMPLNLKAIKVKRINLRQTIEASGELTPSIRAEVVNEFPGRIVEVLVAPGQQVQTGQLIIRLDTALPELELREAQAGLDSAQANKDKIERVLRGGMPTPSTSSGETQQYTVEDLKIAQAQLEQAKVALKMAQGKVEAAQIKAPISGTATEVRAVVGQIVSANSSLATLVDPEQIYFQANVDETDIPRVKLAQETDIVLDAYPDRVLKGEVVEVGQTPATAKTGATVYATKIKVTIARRAELRSGLKGDAKIAVEKRFRTLAIPAQAVVEKGEKRMVFVVKELRLKKREVGIGLVTGETYEILEGLTEGEKVVVERVTRLKGGERVREEEGRAK